MRRMDPVRLELEAQAVAQVRDTLALIHAEDYPRLYKATDLARSAEALADECDQWFYEALGPCPRCAGLTTRVTFSVDLDWRIRCRDCGWSVRRDAWQEAADEWNGDGFLEDTSVDEEEDRCPSPSA